MEDINEELRGQIPFDRLAAQLGVSRDEVAEATELALPALLAGLNANAHQSESSAESLFSALIKDHSGQILDTDDPIERVDPTEGQKIVNHVFGSNSDDVAQRLGSRAGQPSLMTQLLPMLAPIVMGWLSRRLGGAVAQKAPTSTPSAGSGGLGDILGDLLGGKSSETAGSDDGGLGGGLGGMLGGMLGGASGGLGGVLGDLLGGGDNDASNTGQSKPDMGGLIDILGSLAGSAGTKSGASQRMPDLSDLLGR